MKMLFAAIAALSLMGTGLGPASAGTRTVPVTYVADWRISAMYDDETNEFSSCVADFVYKNNAILYFSINRYMRWGPAIKGNFNFKPGASYKVEFNIDNGKIYTYNARAITENLVGGFIDQNDENNDHVFFKMQNGHMLHMRVLGQVYSFQLDGSARTLLTLAECVRSRIDTMLSEPKPSVPARPSAISAAVAPTKPSRGDISMATGFFITGTGRGITNAHVVEGCTSATISGHGPARIIARDPINDMAVVELESKATTAFARFRRTPLQLGETVYAMGFPLAGQLDNGLNFTSGLVSSLAGRGNDARALQFTAPIQQGNSGGPIVDSGGLVVGIIHSKLDDIALLQANGSLPQNINFGIKADLVGSFLRASGFEPTEEETMPAQEATVLARAGLRYTFQITCTAE